MEERLYTAEEVAEYLKIDLRVVRRKAARGLLVGYKLGGKNWRFSESQVKKFLNDCASVQKCTEH